MNETTLFVTAGASAAFAALCGWRGALPPNPMKGPRLVPWRFLLVLGAAAAISALFMALQMAGFGPSGR